MFASVGAEMMRFTPMRGLITVIFSSLVLTGAVILELPSGAHTALVSSTPVAGSTLTEFPGEIRLEFNEPLLSLGENKSNYFELISPSGESIGLSEFSVDQSTVSASILTQPEIGGSYEISYRVVASDGHVIRGSIDFLYESDRPEPAEGEPQVREVAESTTRIPDGVLIGLILLASIAALVIYLKADRENQS